MPRANLDSSDYVFIDLRKADDYKGGPHQGRYRG